MAKEVLLYTSIYDYSAERLITALEESKREDIAMRINSDGGSPESTFGIIAKLREHKGTIDMKVDGRARSMAAFLTLYATGKVEALDTTEFLFHRAAYPSWVEQNPVYMTEGMKETLTRVNADLRAAFEAKVDAAKFKKITGQTFDELFSLDSRIDVILTAKQAQELGIVDSITSITPQRQQEINAMCMRLVAEYNGISGTTEQPQPTPEPIATSTNSKTANSNKMTLAELKAQNPALYAEIVNEGINQERDRVGALMAFIDIDADTVKKAIEEGTNLTQKMSAEFTRKAIAKGALGELAATAVPPVQTGAAPSTTEENQISAEEQNFWNEVGKKTNTKSLQSN